MQQGVNQGQVQFGIVRLLRECLLVKALGVLVLRLLVCHIGGRCLVSRHRGAGGALGEGGAGGKNKGRRRAEREQLYRNSPG